MPPVCNKCKRGFAQEGDTWCLGCSSLEHSLGLLRQPWRHQGLRATAEEALLSSARLCRAFSNLDHSLSSGAGQESRAPLASAKSKGVRPERSRSPRRDTRPPIPRSPARPAAAEDRREDYQDSEDNYSEEEEDEEDDRPPTEVKREDYRPERPPEPDGPPPERASSVRPDKRSRECAEPRRKPRRHTGKRDRGSKRRKRGGTKHQRRFKDVKDPFRRSHRKLRADQVTLASSFAEGLARRY